MDFSPFISKVLYAVLLSPLQSKKSNFVRYQSARFHSRSSYMRTISIINMIDRVIPGYAEKASRLMYRKNRFPWAPVATELIAFGSGTAVIKLNWKNGDKVLRIYRKSLGKPLNELLEIARHYKRNYEIVRACYSSSPGMVLPMDFLLLYGLPFSSPVAASLQPYVHGQKQDLFEDYSDDEILKLLQRHEPVRKQFTFFAKQTIRQWDGQKMCFDFVGRENLMLIQEDGNYRLSIVDVGIFKFDVIAIKYPEKISQIKQRIDRLVSLYELVRER